ncbi:hypothetical protein Q31a_04790 [Aureliella helgolandensis]|uniref:Uncharacterized protein n=1 Tax=Aureliella helgolandensis TaxID=2527968 RepID=A0A518G0T8_9BACT|nr:hypothetical protein Q31a_04790 [Aureliella helgolandensis]
MGWALSLGTGRSISSGPLSDRDDSNYFSPSPLGMLNLRTRRRRYEFALLHLLTYVRVVSKRAPNARRDTQGATRAANSPIKNEEIVKHDK